MRRAPSKDTVKRLFALSGNRCSFPGCDRQIVDPATGNLKGVITHINAVSPGGARYDRTQTDEQRLGVENLILLCHEHHAEIDRDSDTYSVDFLRGVKAANEGRFQRGNLPSEGIATALIATVSENRITDGSAIVSDKQRGGQVAHTIVNVGPHAWGDSLPPEDQLVFRSYDFVARYMGEDWAGEEWPSERVRAKSIDYRFRIEIFNTRSINLGLMDIFVIFAKNENVLCRDVPYRRASATLAHSSVVTSLNLPSNEWTQEAFLGRLSGANVAAVHGCSEIYLISKTVNGFMYKCLLGHSIEEGKMHKG